MNATTGAAGWPGTRFGLDQRPRAEPRFVRRVRQRRGTAANLPAASRRRAWLGELCRIAARLLEKACRAAVPGAKPAFIEFVQTFGDLVNFHPHVHVFCADGTFVPLPAIPEALLERGFRHAVLDFLVGKGAISDERRERILGWRRKGRQGPFPRLRGFSVHNQVRVAAD